MECRDDSDSFQRIRGEVAVASCNGNRSVSRVDTVVLGRKEASGLTRASFNLRGSVVKNFVESTKLSQRSRL